MTKFENSGARVRTSLAELWAAGYAMSMSLQFFRNNASVHARMWEHSEHLLKDEVASWKMDRGGDLSEMLVRACEDVREIAKGRNMMLGRCKWCGLPVYHGPMVSNECPHCGATDARAHLGAHLVRP